MVQAEIWRLLGNKGDRVPFVVADGSTINTGDFLQLADNMVVTAHSGDVDEPMVGIAAHDKVANDGHLLITGITNCIFKALVDGAGCTIGDMCSMGSTAGEVEAHTTLDFEKGWSVGVPYQTAAGGETCLFRSTF